MHRHLIAGCCALAISAGCGNDNSTTSGRSGTGDRVTYQSELDRVDRAIELLVARAAKQPDDWLVRDQIAAAYLGRARISGRYDDYDAARVALADAFAVAVPGSGPWMTRARLDYTLHRFPAVRPSLEFLENRALLTRARRHAIDDLLGEVAFQSGDYRAAKLRFEVALKDQRTPSSLFRMAMYKWRIGDFDGAEQLFLEAQERHHSASATDRAWYHLQLGLMDLDRGRYADALAHYHDGAALVSGWWLLEEHMAEALAKLGRKREAIELYRRVVDATGSPELMDALAALTGDATLLKAAQAAYEDRLARFPEASYGHAFDHFLERSPRRALELAQANLTLRPGVPAQISVAQAHLRSGQADAAWTALAPALDTPVRSAELFATLAIIQTRLGQPAAAANFRTAAKAINPDAMQLEGALSPAS